MPTDNNYLIFVAASLVVLITPGPGVVYVMARSLSQGTRAGLISVLGLATGALFHVTAAIAGLTAILLASAMAYGIVKLVGAGYLFYLGIRMFFGKDASLGVAELEYRSLYRVFVDGVLVSIFNPKIAIFFVAFLPQFVNSSNENISQQIFVLGLLYVFLALLTDGSYAIAASSLRHWISKRIGFRMWPRYLGGSVFIGLGVQTALTGRRD